MDCSNLACTKRAQENKVCRKCYMRVYCSEQCRKADWESLHKNQCKSSLLTISDFLPVSGCSILGKGAYGEVQLVKHISTGQFFALKEIRKSTKSRKIPIKMLFREISVQKNLVHPNVVRLFDHFETVDHIFLFLEYADGGNLFNYMNKKLKVSEKQACSIFSQIALGVNYLHSNNIIHRDIKPDNVLLTKNGNVKICDFGWCAVGMNERSTYCETLDYMAPEIIKGELYTNKVDIWSMGIILYELLQGSVPFKSRNQIEKLRLMSQGKLTFSANISKAAKSLIKKLLNNEPNSRISIQEVLEDEWLLRYSTASTSLLLSPKSKGAEAFNDSDEFDLKLSKNYPTSYNRIIGLTSKIAHVKSHELLPNNLDSLGEQKQNSNHASFVEESQEARTLSILPQDELIKRKSELAKLQSQLEGKKLKSQKSKGFFSSVFGRLSLN